MTRQQPIRLVSCVMVLCIACERNNTGPLASAFLPPRLGVRSHYGKHAEHFPGASVAGASTGAVGTFTLRQQVDGTSSDVYIEIDPNDSSGNITILGNQSIQSDDILIQDVFDKVVNARYACTRFQRHQEPISDSTDSTPSITASVSNPKVVKAALKCLFLSQRAPTGFNSQPYRVILVHEQRQKMAVSEYCLGRNADRVRDSDCTAIFLSDEQVGRDWEKFKNLIDNADNGPSENSSMKRGKSRTRGPLSSKALKKMRILILLFSSGYPLPRVLARPLSLCLRVGLSILASVGRMMHILKQKLSRNQSVILKKISNILPGSLILPTLSSSETWSQKNTMLVAMTFMIACTSRGLSTCPMEGFDAQGIRNALSIPRRFGIPLIVSAGTQFLGDGGVDDVGVSHGDGVMTSPRYHMNEVVFANIFGNPVPCLS